jgi:hypothetical protein
MLLRIVNLEPGHKKSETEKKRFQKEKELHSKCRKLGITFEPPLDNETEEQTRKRCRRNSDKIRKKINNMNLAFKLLISCERWWVRYIFNLSQLVKGPTCFKKVCNPSLVDVIITNKKNMCF